MDITKIIDAFGYVIYAALALLAIWGVITRSSSTGAWPRNRWRDRRRPIQQVANLCQAGKYDAAIAVCQSRPTGTRRWRSSWPWRLQNRDKGIAKIKQLLVMEFHTEVDRGDGEPAGVDLDDRADGPVARPARHGGQHDRRLRPDRRLREGQSLRRWPPTSAWRSGPPARAS